MTKQSICIEIATVVFNVGCYYLLYTHLRPTDFKIVLGGVGIGIIDSFLLAQLLRSLKYTAWKRFHALIVPLPRRSNIALWLSRTAREWKRELPPNLLCFAIAEHYGASWTLTVFVAANTIRKLVSRYICGVYFVDYI